MAIIENIQHFSVHDGPGTRTTIFFKGCPLSCVWCSNPTTQNFAQEILFAQNQCVACGKCQIRCPQGAISHTSKDNLTPCIDRKKCDACAKCVTSCPAEALAVAGQEKSEDQIFSELKKDMLFYANSGGGVTFSGGEMLSHANCVLSLIEKCKAINIHTCAETSGYGKYEHLKSITSQLDILFFDIKHIDTHKHKEITGVYNEKILQNLEKLLVEVSTPIHVRFPLIPSINDDDAHIISYGKYISTLKGLVDVEVLPYHRLGSNKYSMLQKKYTLQHIIPYSQAYLTDRIALLRNYANNIPILCTA